MNRVLKSSEKAKIPDYHALLTELQRLSHADRNKERYNELFCHLSKGMFTDFWGFCEKQVRYLTENRYYVSINETEDILQEVLIKIFRKIDSYRGTCDQQARGWICQIIQNAVRDCSRTTRHRNEVWAYVVSLLHSFLKR
ncbi:MAG: hypothetical protein IJU53_03030 [Thermoguttaceae bacterium]|nr:hypothetical protein [Thermoguttaceae bacterium]